MCRLQLQGKGSFLGLVCGLSSAGEHRPGGAMCPGTQGMNKVVSDQQEGRNHCLDRCFSNFSLHQNHPEGLLKHRFLGHTPRVSDSLGWKGSKMCISNKLPGDNNFFICGPHFEKQWLRCHQQSISEGQAKVPHKRKNQLCVSLMLRGHQQT